MKKTRENSQYGKLKCFDDWFFINAEGTYVEDEDGNAVEFKTDADGKFVDDDIIGKHYLDEIVMFAFKKKKGFDCNGCFISHIDGDINNNSLDNLEWKPLTPKTLTNAPNVYFDDMIVCKDGTLIYGPEREITKVRDHILDTDLDRIWVYNTPKAASYGEGGYMEFNIDEWMDDAEYIAGNKTQFKHPVVLHIDNDVENFHSSNLQWVNESDVRYIEYDKIRSKRRSDLFLSYNRDYSIPHFWQKYIIK